MAVFSTTKLLFFSPFPYCTLWQEVTMCSSPLSTRELWSTSLRAECLCRFLGMLCVKCVYSPSFVYLHQYELMGIYFILWIIIQYCCCLNGSSFGYWELFQASHVSSWYISSSGVLFCFPQHLLTFWHYKMPQAYLVYFLSQS